MACYPSPASAEPRRSPRMEKFVIEGGVPLSGTIVPAGNKNAALPLLAASLLTEEEVVLAQRPAHPRRRGDARAARRPRRRASSWRDDNKVALHGRRASPTTDVDPALAERIRASFLVAGPLLARFGSRRDAAARAAT